VLVERGRFGGPIRFRHFRSAGYCDRHGPPRRKDSDGKNDSSFWRLAAATHREPHWPGVRLTALFSRAFTLHGC